MIWGVALLVGILSVMQLARCLVRWEERQLDVPRAPTTLPADGGRPHPDGSRPPRPRPEAGCHPTRRTARCVVSDERAVAAARRERAAGRRLSVQDQRLVAAFTQLVGDLDNVIDEILGGELDIEDRRALADTFRDLAADLDVMTVPGGVEAVPHPVPPRPLRERSSGPPR